MNRYNAAHEGGTTDGAEDMPLSMNEKGKAAATAPPTNDNPAGEHELIDPEKCNNFSASVDPGVVPADEVVPENPEKDPDNGVVPLNSRNDKRSSIGSAHLNGAPTPEMLEWFRANSEDYEFYMIHAMFHDPLVRISLLSVPVTPDDFLSEESAIVFRALATASKIMGAIGQTLQNPPTEDFMRTYVDSAAREEASEDETVAEAMKLIRKLQDPAYTEQHYCVLPYFEVWYGTMKAKRMARKLIRYSIPDVRGILDEFQTALDAASELNGGINDCAFDYDNVPVPPEAILKLGDNRIATVGNITNIQGPPKAAKSAVVCAVIAATMGQSENPADTLGISADAPAGRAVLHFDTEQSSYDHDSLIRRAYSRVNRREKAEWVRSFCLTGKEPAKCWEFVLGELKKAAEDFSGIMLVIIDGIADFCNDPNDGEECFSLVTKLHRLARNYGCVVLTVLHENPGSNIGKTRGHLGSQLERKAETSLRLKKNSKTGITVMWADNARGCFIPQGAGWRFHWCDNAKMHVNLGEGSEPVGGTKLDKDAKYSDEVLKAFGEVDALSYGDLKLRVTEVTGLAESTAKTRIAEYVGIELVEKSSDGKYRIIRAQSLA